MTSWSARVFFFMLAAFAVYIFASGDQSKWKQLLTQPIKSAA